MKFQPKRFVVEVKRGTNRAAFASPDPSSDRFSNAEAVLFGAAPEPAAKPKTLTASKSEAPTGRILRSLVEPPPPAPEDVPPPVRRGRKPGSKNKPKIHLVMSEPDSIVERPRRGRKPGSKNKPKLNFAQGSAADMRGYGFAEDGAAWQGTVTPETSGPTQANVPATASSEPAEKGETRGGRQAPRLRDRSTILRRYVLDLEPRPGQPGAFRSRRLARAGR